MKRKVIKTKIHNSYETDITNKHKWQEPTIYIIFSIIIICFILFVFNWEIEIDTENLPSVIEYNENVPKPKAYLKGRFFLRDGFEIDVLDESNCDFSSTGFYVNIYSAKFGIYSKRIYKDILVVDTDSPTITLKYRENHYTLPNTDYEEEGYYAYDAYDGDITDKVEKFTNGQTITYFVTDSSGNYVSIDREIDYYDPDAPEIKLIGESTIVLYQGESYEELGAKAQDNIDGDISDKIVISGIVDTSKTGTYILEYKVTDSYNNEAKVSRTIQVAKKIIQEETETIPDKEQKTIYLTFDDGSGLYTEKLLDILDKYEVKATFFVVNNNQYNHLLKEIVARGHNIGIHSVTHDYQTIYSSVDAYLNDLYTMQDIIFRETGVKTNLLRFPGGSSNTVSKNYCEGIMTELTSKVQELGFQYFDWNVTSGDSGDVTNTEMVIQNVISGIQKYKESIVLQHDIKDFSVEAVEDIIVWALENGYTFSALDINSPTAHHHINN